MTNARLSPGELAPRLWEWTRAAVARSGTRGRSVGVAAVCATAGEPRSYPGRGTAAESACPDRPACADALPDGSGQRERARQAVAAHTAGHDGLAALLDMLALHPGQDGDRERRGDGPASDGG